jgi:hypothetical protein
MCWFVAVCDGMKFADDAGNLFKVIRAIVMLAFKEFKQCVRLSLDFPNVATLPFFIGAGEG